MPIITTENWFRTWPERSYERVDSNSLANTVDQSENDNGLSSPNGVVPLSSALSHMSLAYSPLTKKLHMLKPIEQSESSDSKDAKVDFPNCDVRDVSPEDDLKLSIKSADLEQTSFINGDENVKQRNGFTNFLLKFQHGQSSKSSWKFLNKVFNNRTIERPPSNTSLKNVNEGCSQKYGSVIASSSALILNDRPAHLPAKSFDEQDKHRVEHEEMIEAAKKKKEQVALSKQRALEQQLKQEDQQANAVRVWTNEILPRWGHVKDQRKTRELWWAGIPPCVRGRVWRLAVVNELNITRELYGICCKLAEDRLKNSTINRTNSSDSCDNNFGMELIKLDIARTFPHLCIFQKGGPYYDILHRLLSAYVCYRPDVGYVQGMSFIAAILILNMDALDAFICFANILNRPCLMAFFTLSQLGMQAYYDTYEILLKENLPRLHNHLFSINLTPDLYLMEWVVTVFVKSMSLDVSCRVWDVFLRDGEEFIFRSALGVLHCYESELLKLDFVNGAQFLSRLPDSLSSDFLFKSINTIKMQVGRIKFCQLLEAHIEKLTNNSR